MINNLDDILARAETVLAIYLVAVALVLAFVAIGSYLDRRGSPVAKLLRKRFG